ncbi:MAG: hypothetical protein HQK51_10605 [Oligoflexia bacterium]|nr:hypothetical protein [Oligoflexia bacterium]
MRIFRVLGIYRERVYSNHAVEADRNILDAALEKVQNYFKVYDNVIYDNVTNIANVNIESIDGELLQENISNEDICKYDIILSMAQSSEVLKLLSFAEEKSESASANGNRPTPVIIINSVKAIRNCYRLNLSKLLTKNNLFYPEYCLLNTCVRINKLPFASSEGYWLKRVDFHALSDEDVVYVRGGGEEDVDEVNNYIERFKQRSIKSVILQKHIVGDVIKFYGVGDRYFSYRYMDKESIDLENEDVIVYNLIKHIAFRAADVLGLEIYGGDVVVDQEKRVHLIDMNDWPSFRSCVNDASSFMAELVTNKYLNLNVNTNRNYKFGELKENVISPIFCGRVST